nr:unnamed protein product [Digitaria exilis]
MGDRSINVGCADGTQPLGQLPHVSSSGITRLNATVHPRSTSRRTALITSLTSGWPSLATTESKNPWWTRFRTPSVTASEPSCSLSSRTISASEFTPFSLCSGQTWSESSRITTAAASAAAPRPMASRCFTSGRVDSSLDTILAPK